MNRGTTLSLSLPPFTTWVKRLVGVCAAIYLLEVVLQVFSLPWYVTIIRELGLTPQAVMHGRVWQLLTYSLLHGSLLHLLSNMFMLWMFGSQEESDWGRRRFIEFYLACTIGAALFTIAIAYLNLPILSPTTMTIGASGGVLGLLTAFGMLYGDREIFLLFPPVSLKAKYLVMVLVFVVLVSAFSSNGIAEITHLGGIITAFLYLKLLPRRGVTYATSEKVFSLRNAWHRWKRRRAARKFEVYMSQFDRTVKFDEHGNYIPPEGEDKKNGGSDSKWVN